MRVPTDSISVGLLFLVGSRVLREHPAGRVSFWFGASLFAAGAILCRVANLETSPQCADRVNFAALKCKHCSHEFAPQGKSSLSEPFYK